MKYTIRIEDKEVVIPMKWDDLSKNEYLFLCKTFGNLITTAKNKTENFEREYFAAKILMINKLAKIKFRTALKITASQYADMLPIVDFLDKKIDINKNHLPKIRVRCRTFYGPEVGLKFSSFLEFITADTYFINVQKSTDPLMMFKLIACLYRPKQSSISKKKRAGIWNGDMRQAFNDKMITQRAEFFQRHLSAETVQAIFYFYYGFRQKHVLHFKNLFEKPVEEEDNVKRVGNNYGWAGTLLEISGTKFGNISETGKSIWLDVFIELSRQMDKSQLAGT